MLFIITQKLKVQNLRSTCHSKTVDTDDDKKCINMW